MHMFILLLIVLISSFCTETSSKQVTDSGDTAQTQSWSSVDATAPFSKEGMEVNKLDGDLILLEVETAGLVVPGAQDELVSDG